MATQAATRSAAGDTDLAQRIRRMWFTDHLPKTASDIDRIEATSALLGHSGEAVTRKVYRRIGERAKPTR